MVRKANTKAVASKKAVKAPKTRPPVQYTTSEIVVPDKQMNRAQATEFFINCLMPPFGKLSKSVDLKNADATRQFNTFFDRHPDTNNDGVYMFTRPTRGGGDLVIMHQVVQGQAEAALALSIDTVRRGPKTVEYFCSASAMNPPKATAHIAQGIDDAVREDLVRDKEQTEIRHALPNLFHADYPRLTGWLGSFTADVSISEAIKRHVAELIAAATQSSVVTEEAMSNVVFTTAVNAAVNMDADGIQGRVQLQLFTTDHAATKPPFGVIDLGTVWKPAEFPNTYVEQIGKVVGVRQNPFGSGPQQGGWVPNPHGEQRWGEQRWAAEGPQSGGGWGGYRGFEARRAESFGGAHPDFGRQFGSQDFSRKFGGPVPNQPAETFDVTTSSLGRFCAGLQLLIDEQPNPLNKQYIDHMRHKVQGAFYNQAAAQIGSLLFSFQYQGGASLWVTVRDRLTQRSHFIESIMLA